jgi:hypothetical protein
VICPVEFTHELSALRKRRGKLGGGNPSAVLRSGNGADDETARRAVEGMAKKIRMVGCGRDFRRDGSDHAAVAREVRSGRVSGLVDRRKGKPSEKRVPGHVLLEVDRLECQFFEGYEPSFEGDEPPGL